MDNPLLEKSNLRTMKREKKMLLIMANLILPEKSIDLKSTVPLLPHYEILCFEWKPRQFLGCRFSINLFTPTSLVFNSVKMSTSEWKLQFPRHWVQFSGFKEKEAKCQ